MNQSITCKGCQQGSRRNIFTSIVVIIIELYLRFPCFTQGGGSKVDFAARIVLWRVMIT